MPSAHLGVQITRPAMGGPNDRLRKAREDARYTTAAEASRALGVNRFTYCQHENGLRPIPRDAAIRYARFFNVSVGWLLTGRQDRLKKAQAPIVSYIGAGAEIFPLDDHAQGEGLEKIDLPPGVEEPCVAAIIRGNSMHPFKEGWVIFWNKEQDGVPEDCLGQLSVVKLTDGRMLLKVLHRGSRKGRYRLESWNAPTLEDQAVEWAARVLGIKTT